jgi:hypothetical protein
MAAAVTDEYRLIMTGVCGVCVLGCAAGTWPVVDDVASIGVAAAAFSAVIALGARAVRRELRIRRRLSDIQPLHPATCESEPASLEVAR